MPPITINGVDWVPTPGARYKHDYAAIAADIVKGNLPQIDTYRSLIQDDLWFVLFFIVKPWADKHGQAMANHPFVVGMCREVEEGPKDNTLDIWARFHYKSAIITVAETIQYQVSNPNASTAILSFKAPVAKGFLDSIRSVFQKDRMLKVCFPDVVWADCEKEAPMWSLDNGITLKRTTNRKEPSVSAHGLIEGMPTSAHYERMVYDDITHQDLADSVEQMEKVKLRFDVSRNLKTIVGSHHRVVGTYYHHNDPLVYVRQKKNLDGSIKYLLRLKPATEDGRANGKPVLMEQAALDELKGDRSFNCQQLLNPSPVEDQRLNPDFMVRVERKDVPPNLFRVMLIDQAGDLATNIGGAADSWAIGVIGIEPCWDQLGQSKVYLEDLWIQPAAESEAIEQAVRMYLRGGIIQRLGIEKTGLSTTHIHVANALAARGRHIGFDDGSQTGVLLRPAGRNKKKMIESALSWPLNNSKIHYLSSVPAPYMERLRMEMTNFPSWHDDGINMLAYLYDVVQDCQFPVGESADIARMYSEPLKWDGVVGA